MQNQDRKILQIELTSSVLCTVSPSYLTFYSCIGIYTGKRSLDLGTDIPLGTPLPIEA